METRIPVVFSTDDLFIIPAYTAIWSMLNNASTVCFYDLYIMHSGSLSERSIEFLEGIEKIYENCRLSFLSVDESQFEHVSLKEGITVSAMFRLLLSEYLRNYDKCLYIDCDVIVLGDVSVLYATDIKENYIAAIKDCGVQYFYEKNREYAETIGISDMRDYFNSGVLLMNMSAIRKDKLIKDFMACTEHVYLYADQDILNRCCQNRVQYLPLKYNLFRRFYQRLYLLEHTDFGGAELEEAQEAPVILHYAEGSKPWKNIRGTGSGVWWEYAGKALPAEIYQAVRQQAERSEDKGNFKEVIRRASLHKSVIIFGYSYYGKEVFRILRNLGLKQIEAFCDNNPEKRGQVYEGIEVKSLQEIREEFEDVFFINSSQKQRSVVMQILEEHGYRKEVIWNYDHLAAGPKEYMYYAILDQRYYLSELKNIVRMELGMNCDSWKALCGLVRHEEYRFLVDKYFLESWALNPDLIYEEDFHDQDGRS